MTSISAISLWQPWASLVSCGVKRFETRSWAPSRRMVGQRIAVHAGLRVETAFDAETARAIMRALRSRDWSQCIPRGAVVCTAVLAGAYRLGKARDGVARVVDMVQGSAPLQAVGIDLFGDYGVGRWVWRLHQVETLDPPQPVKGRQGWFSVALGGGLAA